MLLTTRTRLLLLTAGISFLLGGLSAQADYEVRFRGNGTLTLTGDGGDATFSVGYPAGGVYKGGTQNNVSKFLAYATKVQMIKAKKPLPPSERVKDCVVSISDRADDINLDYFLLPYFHDGFGLYDPKSVEKFMPEWKKLYKQPPEREITFRFEPDEANGRTLFYVDGSLAGSLKGVRRFTDAKSGKGLEIVRKGALEPRKTPGFYELPALSPGRANAALRNGAKLSLKTGPQTVAGIPMTVWAPEESVDQGLHRKTTPHRDLVWDPMLERTPWRTGPEFFHWRVPGKPWLTAWVLCADLGETGRPPVLGTQFALFGRGCTNGNLDFSRTQVAADEPRAKKVGTLTFGGRSVPLYLVAHPLDIGKLGARGQNKFALDFEFVGTGTHAKERSGVQVFGCTLQVAPYRYKVENSVRGNIFERGTDDPRTGMDVIANIDNVKGSVEIEIVDAYWRTLKKGRRPFALAKAGDTEHLNLNLSKFDLGWYGLNYTFFDERDQVVTRHSAAFTVLAPDDREAGYDSPYACWPLLDGYHGSNPNRTEQLDVMRKAGYRKSWHVPATNEAAGLPWKVTRASVGLGHMQPGSPSKTREGFEKRLDAAVAAYREEFAKYPHCEVIQLLHEQGGRDICDELYLDRPAVRGKYRGWDFDTPGLSDKERGDWEVFFCTEYSKRMRKEFPTKRIMVGNGSSASEKVASLMRRGFDLALVDQLGIESKGFQTMPELASNREAPGMLWALGETGRIFGYSNFTMNACNEYVFRPERPYHVAREVPVRRLFEVTDFTLRDYLVSLAHGCDIISTGHLEDCNDAYYDTNWGAGGQCTFYPYSYPKRMFTALAVLTRVLDAPKFWRRVPTGEPSTYALEFLRQRRTPDYGYAFWTPRYEVSARLDFPEGTAATVYDWQGRATPFSGTVDFGSTPAYVVASKPVRSVRVLRHYQTDLAGMKFETLADFASAKTHPSGGTSPVAAGSQAYGMPGYRGEFEYRKVRDETLGSDALEAVLVDKQIDTRYGNLGGGAGGYGPGSGGSGGGAGAPGVAGEPKARAHEGGKGRLSDITGASLEYARGGNGGDGGAGSWTGDGANGRDGFGDGGGAGNNNYGSGGKGGDGVVIFSLKGKVTRFDAADGEQKYTAPTSGTLRYLAVAGGGGGGATGIGYGAGGGGAGGMTEGTLEVRAGDVLRVTVGRGGAASVYKNRKQISKCANGGDTVIVHKDREIAHMLGGGAEGCFGGSSGGMKANTNSQAPGARHNRLAWAYGGVFFDKPVELTYEKDTAIAVRICGNSSFGKVALALQDEKGVGVDVHGLCYRDYMCFHGWHTLIARIPEKLRVPGAKYKVAGVWFGSAKWTLDPKELVPVSDPIRLKDVMLVRLPKENLPADRRMEAVAADVMKTVDDKDL